MVRGLCPLLQSAFFVEAQSTSYLLVTWQIIESRRTSQCIAEQRVNIRIEDNTPYTLCNMVRSSPHFSILSIQCQPHAHNSKQCPRIRNPHIDSNTKMTELQTPIPCRYSCLSSTICLRKVSSCSYHAWNGRGGSEKENVQVSRVEPSSSGGGDGSLIEEAITPTLTLGSRLLWCRRMTDEVCIAGG
jgi:hypothetical protein